MPYPAAPWKLYGNALQTLHLIDTERVRPLIPPELDIVSVLPGKTVGGIYLSHYNDGSLRYHELIVVPALVSYAGKIASWISHIYVDNPDSVAGGQEIWGLPKEIAQFTSNVNPEQKEAAGRTSITVSQESTTLCTMIHEAPLSLWRQSFSVHCFSTLGNELVSFKATAEMRPGWMTTQLRIPDGSPFSNLNLHAPWLALSLGELDLSVDPPVSLAPLKSGWLRQHNAEI